MPVPTAPLSWRWMRLDKMRASRCREAFVMLNAEGRMQNYGVAYGDLFQSFSVENITILNYELCVTTTN